MGEVRGREGRLTVGKAVVVKTVKPRTAMADLINCMMKMVRLMLCLMVA